MGSWWHVEVGSRELPVFGKSYVSDQVMLLFTDADRFVGHTTGGGSTELGERASDDIESAADSSDWASQRLGYSATVGIIRERLALQGFSSDRVHDLAAAFFDEQNEYDIECDDHEAPKTRAQRYGLDLDLDGTATATALAAPQGLSAASNPWSDDQDDEHRFLGDQWEALRENFHDQRFALSLALSAANPSETVTLDLSHLVNGGWLDIDDMPHRDARARMADTVVAGGPVIVIVEGSTDAHWLRRALEIATPATAHLFNFLEFEAYRVPGGTDRVVSLTKGMAAAGVMNRIVAVLDNDTAGRAAASQLASLRLPPRIAVMTLPEVSYASDYPTLGPEGAAIADVNGRASTIEFMFGSDVLRDSEGSFFPVRWQSFDSVVGGYQGRLARDHKTAIGIRLDQALAKGSESPPEQVMDGCHRLATLLHAAAAPPPLHPNP